MAVLLLNKCQTEFLKTSMPTVNRNISREQQFNDWLQYLMRPNPGQCGILYASHGAKPGHCIIYNPTFPPSLI